MFSPSEEMIFFRRLPKNDADKNSTTFLNEWKQAGIQIGCVQLSRKKTVPTEVGMVFLPDFLSGDFDGMRVKIFQIMKESSVWS
jgi:hypothetical protein